MPSRSNASTPSEAARATVSSGMLPGALSKATRSASRSLTSVTLAMPPMFCSARRRPGARNRRWSASGTRGAPSPPAATSRTRKSLTTGQPVRSAMTAASPICSVAPTCPAERGWCTAVWPCEPMRSTSASGTPAASRHGDGRVGERLAEQHVEVAQLGGVGLRQAEDPLAQRAGERRADEAAHGAAGGVVDPFDGAERGVGAVGAGPRQKADHQPFAALAGGVEARERRALDGEVTVPRSARGPADRRRSLAATPCASPAARARAAPRRSRGA